MEIRIADYEDYLNATSNKKEVNTEVTMEMENTEEVAENVREELDTFRYEESLQPRDW